MNYTYCLIDMPDHPTLETYVNVCRAQVQAYIRYGGDFNADTQLANVAGTQVVLFTEGAFPQIVQIASGFVLKTEDEINALRQTPEWTDP